MEASTLSSPPEHTLTPPVNPKENWDFPPIEEGPLIHGVKFSDTPLTIYDNTFRRHERFTHMVSNLPNGTLREQDALQEPNYNRHGNPISPRRIPAWGVDENGKRIVVNMRDELVITEGRAARIVHSAKRAGHAAVQHIPGAHHLSRLAGGHNHHSNHPRLTEEEIKAQKARELEEIKERLRLNKDLYPDLFKIDNLRLVRAKRWQIANAAADEWKTANNVEELPNDVVAEIRNTAHEQAIIEYAQQFAGGDTSPKVILEIREAARTRDALDRHEHEQRQARTRRRLRYQPGAFDEALRASIERDEGDDTDNKPQGRTQSRQRPARNAGNQQRHQSRRRT